MLNKMLTGEALALIGLGLVIGFFVSWALRLSGKAFMRLMELDHTAETALRQASAIKQAYEEMTSLKFKLEKALSDIPKYEYFNQRLDGQVQVLKDFEKDVQTVKSELYSIREKVSPRI